MCSAQKRMTLTLYHAVRMHAVQEMTYNKPLINLVRSIIVRKNQISILYMYGFFRKDRALSMALHICIIVCISHVFV